MEEYERVRKEMAEELRTYAGKWSGLVDWGQVLIENPEYFLEKANRLLAIKGIRIESDDQGLPKSPYSYYSKCDRTPKEERDSYCDIGYSRAVEDMLKAGFIKCERREDGS